MFLIALNGLVERLGEAAGPWQSLYSDSKLVSATVTFAHVGAMLVGGGMAIAADRHTLRATHGTVDDRTRQLAELEQLHALVIGSLAVVALSGIAMFLSDVDEFARSGTFWVKMGLVVLLLANGALMTRSERALRPASADAAGNSTSSAIARDSATAWSRLRAHAIVSVALWIAITLAGVLLQGG